MFAQIYQYFFVYISRRLFKSTFPNLSMKTNNVNLFYMMQLRSFIYLYHKASPQNLEFISRIQWYLQNINIQ